MRTRVIAASLLAWSGVANASWLEDRISVGVPAEVALVGLGFGVHPELLLRPLRPDGALHVRLAPGVVIGPELSVLPLSLGLREVFLPRKAVRPHIGMGAQLQTFLPYGHAAKVRLDTTVELGVDVRVQDNLRVGLNLGMETGMTPGFGLGATVRAGPTWTF